MRLSHQSKMGLTPWKMRHLGQQAILHKEMINEMTIQWCVQQQYSVNFSKIVTLKIIAALFQNQKIADVFINSDPVLKWSCHTSQRYYISDPGSHPGTLSYFPESIVKLEFQWPLTMDFPALLSSCLPTMLRLQLLASFSTLASQHHHPFSSLVENSLSPALAGPLFQSRAHLISDSIPS